MAIDNRSKVFLHSSLDSVKRVPIVSEGAALVPPILIYVYDWSVGAQGRPHLCLVAINGIDYILKATTGSS